VNRPGGPLRNVSGNSTSSTIAASQTTAFSEARAALRRSAERSMASAERGSE
jgi:hypothetical protein